jgi:hypothetical protein
MDKVIETGIITLFLWILIGQYIIYKAQGQIKSWAQEEHKVVEYQSQPQKMKELDNKYKKLSKNHDSNEIWEKEIQILNYMVMRLNFINPVQTPIMTESFLRKDFRFDMYLAYCYGKTLTKFF